LLGCAEVWQGWTELGGFPHEGPVAVGERL
jgi:hypothetical protein